MANGKQYDAVRPHGIKYDDLMACFKWQVSYFPT